MSNRVEKLKHQARRQEDRRNWVAAIELYGKAVSAAADDGLSPSEVGIYNRIGDLYLKLDDVSQAVYHYLLAVDEYAEAEMYPPAVALCRKILRVAPDQIDAYRKLARLHAATGLMADARQEFDRYLEGVWESGEVRSAVEGLDELAGALMNGKFDAEAFRSLREDGDHEEAFDLLLETWSSADFEADAPAAGTGDVVGEDAGHEATPDDDEAGARPAGAATTPDADDGAGGAAREDDAPAVETEAGPEAGSEAPAEEAPDASPRSRAAAAAPANAEVEATDAALELAAEFGIDLSGLEGSGQGGRILKADVEAALVRGIEAGPAAAAAERGGEAAGPDADRDEDPGAGPVPDVPVPPLAREPRVNPAAAREAIEAYEAPLVVAPVAMAGVAPLAREPRVEPAAAREAVEAYEAPLVVAPVAMAGVAPLAREPRVNPAAAREAIEAYEAPLVVAPVAMAGVAPLDRTPDVEPAAAVEALAAYEAPLVVAPVAMAGVAPLAREPRVEPAAAREAVEAYEAPLVVAPVAMGGVVPLAREPRVEPAAAREAVEAYEAPLVVAPVAMAGVAPLDRTPGVEPAAAVEALAAYEAPLVVAPVAMGGVAPLDRTPRVEPAAAVEALAAYEPPTVVTPFTAEEMATLALRPRVEAAAARAAVEAYEPPLVLAPVTADELAPPPRCPRVSAEQAREAVNAFEPSEEMKALADATFQLIGLGPRGPEHESATEVSSSPARDADDAGTDEDGAPEADGDEGRSEPAVADASGAVADDSAADVADGDDAVRESGREEEPGPGEPVPAAWTGDRHGEDDLPDFTRLLDQIGWLGSGTEETDGAGGSGDGRRPFDVRVPADRSGDGHDGPVPDDPRLKKTLAPWAVEPREALLSGRNGERDADGPEDLDFTELLKEVGWLQGREKNT